MSMTEVQTKQTETTPRPAKPYKGAPMEGLVAKWYTKIRQNDDEVDVLVRRISDLLPAGSRILEVAPGPGYLAIELAKLGKYHIVGVDISRSFVEIARAKAKEAGVAVDFQLGNASDLPFDAAAFDFIICRAAFKNFSEPVAAIREMYRVLKPGGTALILDLNRNASRQEINTLVDDMGLSWINKTMTKWTFKNILLKNAYTKPAIEHFIAQTEFPRHEVREVDVSLEIWLYK
jgi:ubiquinone/menaquinone biosynthesis C-methylase UbiE